MFCHSILNKKFLLDICNGNDSELFYASHLAYSEWKLQA